jgi:predicted nucleic acid-binding protein
MIVLDASVILKWFIREEDTPKAIQFLEAHISSDEQIAVPELLYYEVSNALANKTALSEGDITAALRNLLGLDLVSYSLGAEEYIRAAQLAMRSKITVYDATYAVLAESLKVNFVTADMRLMDSLKGLEFVKML